MFRVIEVRPYAFGWRRIQLRAEGGIHQEDRRLGWGRVHGPTVNSHVLSIPRGTTIGILDHGGDFFVGQQVPPDRVLHRRAFNRFWKRKAEF